MAVITNTNPNSLTVRTFLASWAAMANTDTGTPVRCAQYSDRTIQVFGTFGVGGTLRIEGSNDGTNWAALKDPQGANLEFTAAGIKLASEAPVFVRPVVAAGDGTTALTVLALFRGE